jgi:large conductance mechanosensitive channel
MKYLPLRDFFDYLKQKEVISLAIGVMIAANAQILAKSFVDDMVTPILNPIINSVTNYDDLASWIVEIGPVKIRMGKFINNLLQFLIIGMSIVGMGNFAKKYL